MPGTGEGDEGRGGVFYFVKKSAAYHNFLVREEKKATLFV